MPGNDWDVVSQAPAPVAVTPPPSATPSVSTSTAPGDDWDVVSQANQPVSAVASPAPPAPTSAWQAVKSRLFEPVKEEEIEKIPGLEPQRAEQLQEQGKDTLDTYFGKERGDYIRDHILHGFTPEVDARAAAKTLTDWYAPATLALSAPGRIAHGYAAAAEAAEKTGQVAKAVELAGKARLAGILGTATGVPFVGKQVNSLIDNWSGMTPTERVSALSGILGGTIMTGVGATEGKVPQAAAEKVQDVKDAVQNVVQNRAVQKAAVVGNEDFLSGHSDVKKSIPSTTTTPYEDSDMQRWRVYMEQHHNDIAPIRSVQDAADASNHEIKKIENTVGGLIKDNLPNEPIASDVLGHVREGLEQISKKKDFVDKGMKALTDEYDLNNPKMSEADEIRSELNNDNRGVMAKNKYQRDVARTSDPGFAARELAAEALRDGIYNQLENHGIEGARELRQDEGSIIKIRNAAQKQIENGGKTVRGTGEGTTIGKEIGRGAIELGTTGLGMAAGSAVAGPGTGTAVGALVGNKVGSRAADRLLPVQPDLTRDQLIERSFGKKIAIGTPVQPTVNLHAPPAAEPPKGQQSLLTNPSPLFDTTQTGPEAFATPIDIANAQSDRERPFTQVLADVNATAGEKARAQGEIDRLRATPVPAGMVRAAASAGPANPGPEVLAANKGADVERRAQPYQAILNDPMTGAQERAAAHTQLAKLYKEADKTSASPAAAAKPAANTETPALEKKVSEAPETPKPAPREVFVRQPIPKAAGLGTGSLPELHPEEHAELEKQAGRKLTNEEAQGFRLAQQVNAAAENVGGVDETQAIRQTNKAKMEKPDENRYVKKNGSGESAASQEAINRRASEQAGKITRVRIDTRSGREVPLIGVDAVDAKAGPFDRIVMRKPGSADIILDEGVRAKPIIRGGEGPLSGKK